MLLISGINKNLALSSTRWLGRKAFGDWRVMLCVSEGRVESFQRIVQCGGGEVLVNTPPYLARTGLTHAFVETGNNFKPDIPVAALVEAGVHCLKLEYLPEFLIHGPDPHVLHTHLLEPARLLVTSPPRTLVNKRAINTSLTGTPSKRART